MKYLFPFGKELQPLVQQDQTAKDVFVLGVYASAVHAKWMNGNQIVSRAIAVASEPRIFWDGDPNEARAIINSIKVPYGVGQLEPASKQLNGPSAKLLDENILGVLGFSRRNAWLCDMLPETRLNPNQIKVIEQRYNPLIAQYGLNPVTIPARPSNFCDIARCKEITDELMRSNARQIILLGDLPLKQYLKRVSNVPYTSLQEYVTMYGYGKPTDAVIDGRTFQVIPLTHPRQIGALGGHSAKWFQLHKAWEAEAKLSK